MKKIVFTGGPSAGKSSFMQELKLRLSHRDDIFFAPEVASMLLGNGFPRCKKQENLIYQQKAIYNTQKEMENLLETEAKYSFYFFDRGLLDALAYVEDISTICTDTHEVLKSYDYIFHLQVAPLSSYTKENNKSRTEDYNEAIKLEKKIKDLWSGHKAYNFIESKATFAEKMDTFLSENMLLFKVK